jgi:hypothetical protein
MTLEEFTRENARASVANRNFTRAILTFTDGSHIHFEHSSRDNRWARASAEGTTAESICIGLSQFRLNRRHLQLFFQDGSDVEFQPSEEANGPTLG